MAVFTSLLKEEDALLAILSDVEMTHPHKAVHDAIFLYCIAIHHLLLNPTSKTRAKDAFDIAYKKSEFLSEYVCPKTK